MYSALRLSSPTTTHNHTKYLAMRLWEGEAEQVEVGEKELEEGEKLFSLSEIVSGHILRDGAKYGCVLLPLPGMAQKERGVLCIPQ